MRKSGVRWAILFAVYLSFHGPAFAYLDPATGSIIVQAIIGAVATWWMYSKAYLSKARSLLLRLVAKRNSDHQKWQ